MSVSRPFRRTCRQFVDGEYSEGGRWRYMVDPRFSQSPEHYVRGFALIQKDLLELFDYVEPASLNEECYSYRIHSLFLRACVEFEANCRAVLRENSFSRSGDLSITDYRMLEVSHRLSGYSVRVPNWTGDTGAVRRPFAVWAGTGRLDWYDRYSAVKHDRQQSFRKATFGCLIDAVSALLVVLSAQFGTNDFSPGPGFLMLEGPRDGYESGIGGYFDVHFPDDWPEEDRYDFNWREIEALQDPYQAFDYSKVDTSRGIGGSGGGPGDDSLDFARK